MIINHNCCVKLVRLVIFIYDARSHIHQILNLSRELGTRLFIEFICSEKGQVAGCCVRGL